MTILPLRACDEPVTKAHAEIARQAHRAFSHGSGQTAGLNFGDCFTHALAWATGA